MSLQEVRVATTRNVMSGKVIVGARFRFLGGSYRIATRAKGYYKI